MNKSIFTKVGSLRIVGMALVVATLLGLSPAAEAQRAYPTPQAAAEALADALAISDPQALKQVLGAGPDELVRLGVDRDDIYAFMAAWARHHEIVPVDDKKASLVVGDSGWTLPTPLVRTGSGWRFDPVAGAAEMQRRTVGRNELAAMDALRTLSEAQTRYAQGVGQGHYATRLVSRPGMRDGLYWPQISGAPEQAFGADALAMEPQAPVEDAFAGYRFQILPGADAKTYQIVAWPARYGQTGRSTFVITSDGRLLEADLGPSSSRLAPRLRAGDLNSGNWQPAA